MHQLKRRKISSTQNNEPASPAVIEFRKKVVQALENSKNFEWGHMYDIHIDSVKKMSELDDEDEKIRRIIQSGRFTFRYVLSRKNTHVVKRIFADLFGKKNKVPGKQIVLDCLTKKFFGEDPEFLKRDKEEVNLKDVDLRDFQFIEMKEILIPAEIILKILEYLEYNKHLLYNVGAACKGFYVSILCSWNKPIPVKKRTLYDVPLLVLQNVKEIEIVETNSKEKFINSERSYLLSNLKKIRSVTFHSSFVSFEKNIVSYERIIKKMKGECPFSKVTELTFKFHHPRARTAVKKIRNTTKWKGNVHKVFPSLKTFRHPTPSFVLEGTTIENYVFSRGSDEAWNFQEGLREMNSIQNIKKYVNPERITRMALRIFTLTYGGNREDNEFLRHIFLYFKRLRKFTLEHKYFIKLNLSDLSNLKNITQINLDSFSFDGPEFVHTGWVDGSRESEMMEIELPTKLETVREVQFFGTFRNNFEDVMKILSICKNLKVFRVIHGERLKFRNEETVLTKISELMGRIGGLEYFRFELNVSPITYSGGYSRTSGKRLLSIGRKPVFFPFSEDEDRRCFTIVMEKNRKKKHFLFGKVFDPVVPSHLQVYQKDGELDMEMEGVLKNTKKCKFLSTISEELSQFLEDGSVTKVSVFSQRFEFEYIFDWDEIKKSFSREIREMEDSDGFDPKLMIFGENPNKIRIREPHHVTRTRRKVSWNEEEEEEERLNVKKWKVRRFFF